jgi:hypothetical protein
VFFCRRICSIKLIFLIPHPVHYTVKMSLMQDSAHQETASPNLEKGFTTDYIFQFSLDYENGADLALYNNQLTYEYHKKTVYRNVYPIIYTWNEPQIHKGQALDDDLEDLWLFRVHIASTKSMVFCIGPYRFELSEDWSFLQEMRSKDCFLNWADPETRDRYVAIRVPKLDNPTITVGASDGEYAGLDFVGLFIKKNAQKLTEFVTIWTTADLNEAYAERHKDKSWYNSDSGIDLCRREFSLQPKQLFTCDNQKKLYPLFTTQTPGSLYSKEHLARANETPIACHMWFVKRVTTVHSNLSSRIPNPSGSSENPGDPSENLVNLSANWNETPVPPVLNYCTGISFKETAGQGWEILLDVFVNVLDLVTHLSTGNVAGASGDVWKMVKPHVEKEFLDLARGEGFITALSEMFKKAREKDPKVKEYNVNLKSVEELVEQDTFEDKDFGFQV